MSTPSKNELFENAAMDLADHLGAMHGTMFMLISALRDTELTREQARLLSAAEADLADSQARFFAQYADMLGGAAPERN